MSNIKEFKKELKVLLAKHNAYIGFSVGDGSDTHGLYNERMEVEFKTDKGWKCHQLANGWSVDASDL